MGNFEDYASVFLEKHCFDCHDDETSEAGLNLLDLGKVDETNAEVWKSVWAQVSLGEMPPKKKAQPSIVDRLRFSDWVISELSREMKDKGGFHAHKDPNKGNFLNHDLLFGPLPEGIRLQPTSSPARIWRVTPQEHITRLNDLINLEPAYDPEKPGLRTRGDAVPTNHGGAQNVFRNGPDHQMGRGHRGLCHGSEERARRAFLRPQARLGKLSLLLFGKRIRSQADSRQGRGRASLHGLRAAQLGRVSRTNHRRPQDLGQGQTQGRSSGSAYRHRVQHQGLPADHSGLRLDEGRKAHRRGPSSRGQLSSRP